mmetsp:Transcript_39086/g.63145  ORF Transcript_39086/g.63145 Transcript_39086/m.63145 type:complete len:93 (+) Transcript_39086:351-629(+)
MHRECFSSHKKPGSGFVKSFTQVTTCILHCQSSRETTPFSVLLPPFTCPFVGPLLLGHLEWRRVNDERGWEWLRISWLQLAQVLGRKGIEGD